MPLQQTDKVFLGCISKATVHQLNEATTVLSWRAVPSAGLSCGGSWTRPVIIKGLKAPDRGRDRAGIMQPAEKRAQQGSVSSVCINTGAEAEEESTEDGSRLSDLMRGSYAQAELQQIPLIHNSSTFHYEEGQTDCPKRQWSLNTWRYSIPNWT